MKFGEKISDQTPRGQKPKYIIRTDFKHYIELTPEHKADLYKKFVVMRRGVKRYDAIMTLAVYQEVKPEAISQVLREDYNHCV